MCIYIYIYIYIYTYISIGRIISILKQRNSFTLFYNYILKYITIHYTFIRRNLLSVYVTVVLLRTIVILYPIGSIYCYTIS